MRLAVVGANGRMGKECIAAINRIDGVKLAAALVRKGSELVGKDAGLFAGGEKCGVKITDDPLLALAKADGILDFTLPDASVNYASYAAQAGIVHIIGTTGFTNEQEEKIKIASKKAKIVKSGNMSLGVNLLEILVEQAAKSLEPQDYDIEISEIHHRRKVDAPSGTALLLGEAAARGRGVALKDVRENLRDGHTGAREDGKIGFASLRGGTIIGDHSVYFAGAGECIILSHHAQNRSIYADGAVKAALWANKRNAGLYTMRDVLQQN